MESNVLGDAARVERKTPGSGSARKVLQILFSFSERRTSATVAELAALVGTPTPTTYRHVALLKELRLLEEGADGTYHPTARVMPLARAAQLSNTMAELAAPIVSDAADEFNETVMLMQHQGDSVVCVQVKEIDRPMRFTFQRGHTVPLGVGASGKHVLALLPLASQRSWLSAHPERQLDTELDQIAEAGFSSSNGEIDAGVWACSVAVDTEKSTPVVLTVAGPAARFDDFTKAEAPRILREHADRIRVAWRRYSL